MKFFFATYDAVGHAQPVGAVVQEMVRRGHEVVWMTGEDVKYIADRVGATHVYTNKMKPLDDAAKPKLNGPLSARKMVDAIINGRTIAQVSDYRDTLKSFPADCVVVDIAPSGAQALYELDGHVYATLQVFPLWASAPNLPLAFSGMMPPKGIIQYALNQVMRFISRYVIFPLYIMRPINADRISLGLPKIPVPLMGERFVRSPFLNIQTSSPSMEFFDEGLIAKYSNVHFVGPVFVPGKDSSNPEEYLRWSRLLDHPKIVFVTQGTFATDPFALILPTMRALAGRSDVRVIVTSFHIDALKEKETAPPNTYLERYIPYELVLERAAVCVTNGGYGGVKQAMLFGVPLVCAGTTEDKSDVIARVVWNGAGISLGTDNPSDRQVQDAVSKVLSEDSYRRNARRIGDEFKALGGVSHAADLLEQLARTKKEVLH